MTGGLLQLAAYGSQDIFLTGNPQITFFVAVYKRYSNFAIESIEQLFTGNVDFGKRVYCEIGRSGDLINEIFIKIKLPKLNSPEGVYSSWVNSIGHALIKKYEIEIGGTLIDRHYGQWLEIWNELTIDNNKIYGYNQMIGKHEYFNANTQEGPLNLNIPLKFWFCNNKGLSLPLIALQRHAVRIYIDFRDLNELWVSTDKNAVILLQDTLGTYTITEASLYIDYIFLEDAERIWFAKQSHEYLFEQLQINTVSLNINNRSNIIDLDFNHPIKELIWVIQTSDILEENEWFNFGDVSYNRNIAQSDPLINCKLMIEGKDRFSERDADFFRIIQPYQRHTRIPNNYIYVYSFAYNPESYQPSGTCNFSRIDTASLSIKIKDNLNEPAIAIYASNYNILKITNGMAGVGYSN